MAVLTTHGKGIDERGKSLWYNKPNCLSHVATTTVWVSFGS